MWLCYLLIYCFLFMSFSSSFGNTPPDAVLFHPCLIYCCCFWSIYFFYSIYLIAACLCNGIWFSFVFCIIDMLFLWNFSTELYLFFWICIEFSSIDTNLPFCELSCLELWEDGFVGMRFELRSSMLFWFERSVRFWWPRYGTEAKFVRCSWLCLLLLDCRDILPERFPSRTRGCIAIVLWLLMLNTLGKELDRPLGDRVDFELFSRVESLLVFEIGTSFLPFWCLYVCITDSLIWIMFVSLSNLSRTRFCGAIDMNSFLTNFTVFAFDWEYTSFTFFFCSFNTVYTFVL